MGWAYIQTDLGGHRQVLNADGPKKAEFTLNEKEQFRRALVYSSRHGLWEASDVNALN